MEVGKYAILATVSGDGLLSEVVNGMFDRSDWQELISRTAIHTIPGGSGSSSIRSCRHNPLGVLQQATAWPRAF